MFSAGEQVGGLRIERELGRGAYGVVYLARDALIGRAVALKVLPGGNDAPARELRDQVLTEARLVGNLNSPNVVTLYRLRSSDDGGWMLEMEFVGGGSLEDELAAGEPLPLERALDVFRGIVRALKAAHDARVIHGDLKPGNVLFDEQGTVKLADFGLARMLEGGGTTIELHGEIFGTPAYMAPEVLSGESAGIPSDLWGSGALLHQMLSGGLPFPAADFAELWSGIVDGEPAPLPDTVPGPVGGLVARCLEKDPAARPASAAALLELLEQAAGADEALAPAAAARDHPTNVKAPPTSFVGRERELDAIGALLADPDTRLLTLTGPGGIGKTRLSLRLCESQLERFEGGCWFADLSDCRDALDVARAVAQALDAPPPAQADPVEHVGALLALRKPLLLVLDNFEQVVDHAGDTVGAWREKAAGARFLVTSRALLGIAGERDFELTPLQAPRPAPGETLDPDAALEFAGVRLFTDRATEANPRFVLDADNAADVARICRELDGMPLAIELAAARARIMKPRQIAEKLFSKFALLKSTRKDLRARQATLTGAIDWSFELLADWEKAAFLQACVFRGGFTLEAAEAVIDLSAFDDAPLAMDAVQSLREKSLLRAFDTAMDLRLDLYNAIREYGEERWRRTASADEQRALEQRHQDHILEYCEEWNDRIPGARELEALDRIEAELGNLEAVHDRALARGRPAPAARAILASAPTMLVRRPPRALIPLLESSLVVGEETFGVGPARELGIALVAALELSGEWDRAVELVDGIVVWTAGAGDARLRAEALLLQADLRRKRGRLEEAAASFTKAEETARNARAAHLVARAVGGQGSVLSQQGRREDAVRLWSEAVALARGAGDAVTTVRYTLNTGVGSEMAGELDGAIARYREAEDAARRLMDRYWTAYALTAQANAHLKKGDGDEALRLYRDAEHLARETGNREMLGTILGSRGSVHTQRGELDEALACYETSEEIARDTGHKLRLAMVLGMRGTLLRRRDDLDGARACYAEALSVAKEIGDRASIALNRCRIGLVHRLRGEDADARTELTRGLDAARDAGVAASPTYFTFMAALAGLCLRLDDEAEARRWTSEALDLSLRLGLRPDHASRDVADALSQLAGYAKRLKLTDAGDAGRTPPADPR